MLGGQRIPLSRSEQPLYVTPVVVTLTVPSPSAVFGVPPIRKSGSYITTIGKNASYTPSIYKVQVGDV